ncbi:MAG: calcium/sodium antiporter [Vicingaceae bacterium]
MQFLLVIGGLVVLILGGEFLVRGAVGLALKFNISPLVIGMTVVSFGTSAPELLVSLEGALSGHPDVSVGAVVGSNISNLGLVLGITVIIFPIVVNRDSIRKDWPIMMFATLLFYFFAQDEILEFWEGFIFLTILILFSTWIIIKSRNHGKKIAAEEEIKEDEVSSSSPKNLFFILLGLVGLYFGAEWLIKGVVSLAETFGISEKLVSVSIVAFGTSLPELVTSAVAAFRKETDISMGNLIGSNLFNILAILGITALVSPLKISQSVNQFDMYFLLGVSLLIFPFMVFGKKIGLWKGVVLVLYYAVYIYFSISLEI